MSQIKSIMNNLSKEELEKLQFAFDNNESYYTKYEKDKYIGINIENIPEFIELEKHGEWSLGELKDVSRSMYYRKKSM